MFVLFVWPLLTLSAIINNYIERSEHVFSLHTCLKKFSFCILPGMDMDVAEDDKVPSFLIEDMLDSFTGYEHLSFEAGEKLFQCVVEIFSVRFERCSTIENFRSLTAAFTIVATSKKLFQCVIEIFSMRFERCPTIENFRPLTAAIAHKHCRSP